MTSKDVTHIGCGDEVTCGACKLTEQADFCATGDVRVAA